MKRKRQAKSQPTESEDEEYEIEQIKEEEVSENEAEPQEASDELRNAEQSRKEKYQNHVSINAELIKKAITAVNRLTDDCHIFGDFVANELRSMKSQKARVKLQSKIQKAILKIAEEDESLCQENATANN